MKTKNIWTDLTSIILLVFIFGGMVLHIVTPDRTFSDMENRNLASLPEFTWDKFISGQYTKDLETYMSDQFFWRDAWVGLQAASQQLLGRAENNGIYFAGDKLLEQFKEPNPDYVTGAFNAMAKLPDITGVKTVFSLIPTGAWLYSDLLPAGAPGYDQGILLDKGAQLDFYFDLASVLKEHKDEYIWFNTDHHWTTLGAYYAYAALGEQLGYTPLTPEQLGELAVLDQPFYGTAYSSAGVRWGYEDSFSYYPALDMDFSWTEDGINWTEGKLYHTDKLAVKDKYTFFCGSNYPMATVTNPDAEGTLLLIKDSYSNALLPFLAQHYGTIHLVDARYSRMPLSMYLQDKQIDACLALYQTGNFTQDTAFALICR